MESCKLNLGNSFNNSNIWSRQQKYSNSQNKVKVGMLYVEAQVVYRART